MLYPEFYGNKGECDKREALSFLSNLHYRARRAEWRKTIISRKFICALILFKNKQLRLRVRTRII